MIAVVQAGLYKTARTCIVVETEEGWLQETGPTPRSPGLGDARSHPEEEAEGSGSSEDELAVCPSGLEHYRRRSSKEP